MLPLTRRGAIAGAAALALAACAKRPLAPPPRRPIPVIFHTDIGGDVDDTWALLQILRSPELDLKLVATDAGGTGYGARLATKLLDRAGRAHVPVSLGLDAGDYDGRQSAWVGDWQLSDYRGPVLRDGAQAMVDAILASPEPVTVISVGPAPTLAAALRREPAIARNAKLVGMFGSIRLGYDGAPTPAAENNVKVDPAALRTIFEAPWEKTITPLDTCGLVVLDGPLWQRFKASDDPFARMILANHRVWAPRAEWLPKDFDAEAQSSTLFDTVAVQLAFDESLVEMETLPLRVTDDGFTVVDTANGVPVRCATAWRNLAAFEALLVARLTQHGLASPASA